MPAAPSASCMSSSSGLPPARVSTSSVTDSSGSPPSWKRSARSAVCRRASRSSRCGTGRIMPTSSSGRCRADRDSRSHRVTLAWSAHWRSSTTRTVGSAVHSSLDEREQLLGQRGGHILAAAGRDLAAQQRDDGFLPRVGRGLADPQPVQDGQQRQRLPQFVTGAPEHLAARSAASAQAARTSVDLPMPGSPSMSTAWPCPAVASAAQLISRDSSRSRPTSWPAKDGSGTRWIVPPEYGRNKRFRPGKRRYKRILAGPARDHAHDAVGFDFHVNVSSMQFAVRFARPFACHLHAILLSVS